MTDIEALRIGFLLAIIGVWYAVAGFRSFQHAEKLLQSAQEDRRAAQRAGRDLQRFVLLWNYGAKQEAYEHLVECGFAVSGSCQDGQNVRD